jgi:hypothetical protein
MIKSRRIRWAGYIESMGGRGGGLGGGRIYVGFFVGNPVGK